MKKSTKSKNIFCHNQKCYLVALDKNLGLQHQQRKSIIGKTFGIFPENPISQDSFGPEPRDSMTKIRDFHDFLEMMPSLKSHNFRATEPILKVRYSLKNYESESLISAEILSFCQSYGTPRSTSLKRFLQKSHAQP